MGISTKKDFAGTVTVEGEILTEVFHCMDEVILGIKTAGESGSIHVRIPIEDAKQVLDKLASQIEVCIREKDLQDQTIALGIQEDYNV